MSALNSIFGLLGWGVKDKIIAALALILVIIIFLSGMWVGLQFTFASVNTDTIEYTQNAITGHVELSQTAYATSWRSDGQSETISISNTYITKGTSFAHCTEGRYRVFANGEDITAEIWGAPYEVHAPLSIIGESDEGKYFETPPPFHLNGIYVGYITIKFYGDVADYHGLITHHDTLLSEDSAYLKSGEGKIQVNGNTQTTTFEEGQSITFNIQTGFTNQQGWVMKIREPAQRGGSVIYTSQTLDDDKMLQLSWTIPDGAFHPREDNEFSAELWNNLFQDCFTTVFVVDDLDKIPSTPIINTTSPDGRYSLGTPVTVNLAAEANPAGAPIDHFEIYVYYGQAGTFPSTTDTYNWIAQKVDVQATKTIGDNYTGTYVFNIPENHEGNIIIQANAIDTDGRASQGSYWQISTGGKAGPTIKNWFAFSFYMEILLIISAILFTLIIWWYVPLGYKFKALMLLVLYAGLFYVWYSTIGGV